MIADRRYLAAQVQELRLELSLLTEWIDNPDRQFPGDAVALARQGRRIADLLEADGMPGDSQEERVMGTPWVTVLLFGAGALWIGWTVRDIVRDVRGRRS